MQTQLETPFGPLNLIIQKIRRINWSTTEAYNTFLAIADGNATVNKVPYHVRLELVAPIGNNGPWRSESVEIDRLDKKVIHNINAQKKLTNDVTNALTNALKVEWLLTAIEEKHQQDIKETKTEIETLTKTLKEKQRILQNLCQESPAQQLRDFLTKHPKIRKQTNE